PTSRPRIRSVTGAAPPSRPAPGVPTMPTAAAPSVTRTVPTPRFGAAWLGGARASTRTPRGTAARPEPSAVRCRSLTTCTSRAGTRRSRAWGRVAARRPARAARSTPSAKAGAAGVAASSVARSGAPPRSGTGAAETPPPGARGARASGARRGSPRLRAPQAPTDAGKSRQQPQRHAERHVGQDVVVRNAVPPARRAPSVDLPTHGGLVGPRQLARPNHHARRRFRIPVPHFGRAGELGLRRIHGVQHDHLMATMTQVAQCRKRQLTVEQQVGDEYDEPPPGEQRRET